jgi:aspartate/methionine/tyrosine aminotransferase
LPEGTDDLALAERLHVEHGVLVVPGCLFEAPGTLRVSWLQAGDRLEEGLARLADEVAATIV